MKTKLNGQNVTHIDTETGEIICQTEGCTEITDSNLSEDEKRKKEYEKTHVTNFNEGASFVKLYLNVNNLRKNLTQSEFTIAISLADFVCYDDCILRRGGHHNGEILSIKSLAEEMDLKYDSLQKTLNSLIKKGVVGIHKTGCRDNPNIMIKAITVNPYIFSKGKSVNKTILSLFHHSNWNED